MIFLYFSYLAPQLSNCCFLSYCSIVQSSVLKYTSARLSSNLFSITKSIILFTNKPLKDPSDKIIFYQHTTSKEPTLFFLKLSYI